MLSLITTTSALGTTLPDGSVTVPRSVLEIVCEIPLEVTSNPAIRSTTGKRSLIDSCNMFNEHGAPLPFGDHHWSTGILVVAVEGWIISHRLNDGAVVHALGNTPEAEGNVTPFPGEGALAICPDRPILSGMEPYSPREGDFSVARRFHENCERLAWLGAKGATR